MHMNIFSPALLGAALALLMSQSASAADSASAEFATGNKTKMARIGLQWDWNKQWMQSNGTHVGGYWDATLAQWRGNKFQGTDGAYQNLIDIGITPVFRFQSDSRKGLYAEGGIGIHLLSGLYDNNGRKFPTVLQFGDHIGVGYVTESGVDISLKIQHFSNGSIKRPNPGVNYAVLKVGYAF